MNRKKKKEEGDKGRKRGTNGNKGVFFTRAEVKVLIYLCDVHQNVTAGSNGPFPHPPPALVSINGHPLSTMQVHVT